VAGFVAENAERRRAKRKMPPFDRRQADPSRGEYASELAMREERDVALQRLKMGDEAIGAGGDLLGRFTARTTIPNTFQSGRSLRMSTDAPVLRSRHSSNSDRSGSMTAKHRTRLARTFAGPLAAGWVRTRAKLDFRRHGFKFARLFFAMRSQRNVRDSVCWPVRDQAVSPLFE